MSCWFWFFFYCTPEKVACLILHSPGILKLTLGKKSWHFLCFSPEFHLVTVFSVTVDKKYAEAFQAKRINWMKLIPVVTRCVQSAKKPTRMPAQRHSKVANAQLFSPAIQILNNVSPFTFSNSWVWTGNQGFWTNQKSNTSTGMKTIHCSDDLLYHGVALSWQYCFCIVWSCFF